MGVDVTHIIRHNHSEVANCRKSAKFALDTAKCIAEHFHAEVPKVYRLDLLGDDMFNLEKPPRPGETPIWEFDFPKDVLFGMEFILRPGYWQVESYFHYCHLFAYHKDHGFWLRTAVHDVATLLNETECWHAQEFYTYNCAKFDIDDPTSTIDKWIEFAKSTGKYGEFDAQILKWSEDVNLRDLNYQPIYHDSFEDLRNN